MLIKDLKPRMTFDSIELEIVTKGEPRAFSNASGQGTVCSAAAKDSEGKEISLTLWGEQYKEVNDGDKIVIKNGWTSEYQGQLQISTGKNGTLEVIK
ncbi:MAG: hypothetical protein GX950_02600 [Candidatus Diapherotrites archaeon]|uniref:DNA-binding protein n=1 Tax=Candidatus Iainarchaeum sp. TaxID=3101447 RepID=A0A7K4C023_9ARCH|nr:hypothetical protein [Candidatus Diapherotrites archaeon]